MDTLTGVVDRVVTERMPYVERADVKRSHAAMFDPKAGPPAFTDEELTSLPHTTLCVHGRDDIIVPVESSTYLAKTMPNATLHIIPKCGPLDADRGARHVRLPPREPHRRQVLRLGNKHKSHAVCRWARSAAPLTSGGGRRQSAAGVGTH